MGATHTFIQRWWNQGPERENEHSHVVTEGLKPDMMRTDIHKGVGKWTADKP